MAGVTADHTKFHTVVAAIESNVVAQIADAVHNPPRNNISNAEFMNVLGKVSRSCRMRAILQSSKEDLLGLAKLADNILDAGGPNNAV